MLSREVIGQIPKDIISQAREFTFHLVINRESESDLNPENDRITPGLWQTSFTRRGGGMEEGRLGRDLSQRAES